MLKETVISRDVVTAAHTLDHDVGAATYSAAPTLATQGFYLRAAAGRNYDAYEITATFAGGDGSAVAIIRPWYWVPAHDPTGVAGGSWIAGKYIEGISAGAIATDTMAPARRLNSVPVAATRCYLQVVSIANTAPTHVYVTCYGLEGPVATVDAESIEVDIEGGDIELGAVEIKDHTTDDRAHVKNANAAVGVDDHVVMMQIQGPDGLPMPSGANAAGAVYVLPVGGGAAGGGDSVYTSPADFTVTRNAATELLITGLPFAPILAQIVSIYKVDIVTGIGYTYTTSTNTLFWNPGTGILTVTGAAFLATDEFRVTLFGPDKAATPATDSKRVQEISPLSAQNVWENLLSTAALAAGTYYYPSASGMSLAGFRNVSVGLQLSITATATMEGSIDPTGTDFYDVSRSGYDLQSGASGVANWSGTNAILDYEELGIGLLRVKVVVVGANATVQIDVRRTAI